jgi:hypothetical protein
MTREKALGLILGLSAGILVDSCLIVLLSFLIIFLSPILLAPPVFGILWGLRSAREGRLPAWNWSKIILTGGIFLILAVLIPYFVAAGELRWHGTQIPQPPDSIMVEVRTGPFGSSMAGPSVTKIMETKASEATVLSYYWTELGKDGWQLFSELENGNWFVRSGRHIFVRLAGKQGRTLITVSYHQDRVIGPWLVLLLILISLIYAWIKGRGPKYDF